MNPAPMTPEKQMMGIILGKWISKPVNSACRLGIPDILSRGSKHIDEIAELTGTKSDPLYRMMRALACVEVFSETSPRVFINTRLSECLVEGRLKSAVLMFQSQWHDRMWGELLYSIQTGKPAFDKVHGEPAFRWFQKNPEHSREFHRANCIKAATSHAAAIRNYDFNMARTITDVGGGYGGLVVEFLKSYPHIKAVVAELPETVPHIDEVIGENGMESRMRAVECDFFKEVPGGSDLFLLSHILHDWSDDKCLAILKNCRAATGDNGKLLVLEAVVPTGNDFSISKLLDLEVLLMGGGRERSIKEFEHLFERSRFRLSRIVHTDEGISILEGTPA